MNLIINIVSLILAMVIVTRAILFLVVLNRIVFSNVLDLSVIKKPKLIPDTPELVN